MRRKLRFDSGLIVDYKKNGDVYLLNLDEPAQRLAAIWNLKEHKSGPMGNRYVPTNRHSELDSWLTIRKLRLMEIS